MRKSQEEVLNELKLRRLIRKAVQIREAKNKKTKEKQLLEEEKLRKVIRHLIKEGDVDSDTKPAPYASTPVNALADAFNQILPVLKSGLRSLSEPEERMSYRAHVLEKFKSIFGNFEGLDAKQLGPIGESDLTEQEGSIKISLDDDDRIMPSDGKEDDRFKEPEKDPEKELEKEFDGFKMAGENPTGARVAFETINDSNIEQVLSDKRKVLYKPDYKEEFKDYAMYNVDLWLLTYEKELADSLGQQPAFEDTVMPKPSGAETKGVASEFEGGGSAPMGQEGDVSVEAEPLADEGELPPPV
jgi:hypothetical protein